MDSWAVGAYAHEPSSRLLKGSYIRDYIGNYYRVI